VMQVRATVLAIFTAGLVVRARFLPEKAFWSLCTVFMLDPCRYVVNTRQDCRHRKKRGCGRTVPCSSL